MTPSEQQSAHPAPCTELETSFRCDLRSDLLGDLRSDFCGDLHSDLYSDFRGDLCSDLRSDLRTSSILSCFRNLDVRVSVSVQGVQSV